MSRLNQLQTMMAELIAMQKASVSAMNELIQLTKSETQRNEWSTPVETAELVKIVGEKSLREMASDGRLVYGEHYVQDDAGRYKFMPSRVEEYFVLHPPEGRGRNAIAA